jgi:peptide/nickel transport system permease protein
MRGNSISVLGNDYLRVARMRGLSERRIATNYVAKNAILPMYTGLMISIGFMFGGSIILEEIFRYRGMGYYVFTSIGSRDYPLMMGGFITITVAVVISIFIADLTYGKLDPRVRRGDEREAY